MSRSEYYVYDMSAPGGDGADVFVCGGSRGLETVYDFEVGIDKVEVRAQGRELQVDLVSEPGSTAITLDGIGPVVLLAGVQVTVEHLVII